MVNVCWAKLKPCNKQSIKVQYISFWDKRIPAKVYNVKRKKCKKMLMFSDWGLVNQRLVENVVKVGIVEIVNFFFYNFYNHYNTYNHT